MPIKYEEYYDSKDKQKSYVLKGKPEQTKIIILGNTLSNAKVNGINGTFFDTPRPALPQSCWGLAVNDGKPIGANAYTTSGKGIKRGVIAWNGKEMICKRINRYTEIPNMKWGISGVMLMPDYNRYVEKYLSDIYRKTNHTVIGFDKNFNIYMFVRTYSTMERLVKSCKFFNLIGAISLDGGGSSQLNYNGKGYKSTRKINSAIIFE
ncbi:MAG: phosphodiester glycosidase family protein [Lachnospiraceae bacterium]|nr:phosphodiester glycosidase family protein [Lachnospiraceae bacterium]